MRNQENTNASSATTYAKVRELVIKRLLLHKLRCNEKCNSART